MVFALKHKLDEEEVKVCGNRNLAFGKGSCKRQSNIWGEIRDW